MRRGKERKVMENEGKREENCIPECLFNVLDFFFLNQISHFLVSDQELMLINCNILHGVKISVETGLLPIDSYP